MPLCRQRLAMIFSVGIYQTYSRWKRYDIRRAVKNIWRILAYVCLFLMILFVQNKSDIVENFHVIGKKKKRIIHCWNLEFNEPKDQTWKNKQETNLMKILNTCARTTLISKHLSSTNELMKFKNCKEILIVVDNSKEKIEKEKNYELHQMT